MCELNSQSPITNSIGNHQSQITNNQQSPITDPQIGLNEPRPTRLAPGRV
jgi:hypothetical protein